MQKYLSLSSIHRHKIFTLTLKCLVIKAILNDINNHATCFMEVVFSQLKQPQVHVGDGIEGPTGQQHHFSLRVRILHGHCSQPGSQVDSVGASHYKKWEKKELLLLTCAANKQKIKFQDQIECWTFLHQPGLTVHVTLLCTISK